MCVDSFNGILVVIYTVSSIVVRLEVMGHTDYQRDSFPDTHMPSGCASNESCPKAERFWKERSNPHRLRG